MEWIYGWVSGWVAGAVQSGECSGRLQGCVAGAGDEEWRDAFAGESSGEVAAVPQEFRARSPTLVRLEQSSLV